MSTEVRRASIGVTLCFLLNGVAWSTLLPRFPEIKGTLQIRDWLWGFIIALGPIAGLILGMFTARLMRRFQSAGVAVIFQTLGIACLNLLGNAPNAAVFALGVVLMMSTDSVTDIAMNAHGLRVQQRYGRSILNGFHAWWSVGAVAGGFIGSACAQLGERALVCAGWSDFSGLPRMEHVKVVNAANYADIFPDCRAVVHHGGAGTTAVSLRAGTPTLILWMADVQLIWGAAIKRLKVGTARRFSTVTEKSLVADLRTILAPEYSARARDVATRMSDPAKSATAAADHVEDFARSH